MAGTTLPVKTVRHGQSRMVDKTVLKMVGIDTGTVEVIKIEEEVFLRPLWVVAEDLTVQCYVFARTPIPAEDTCR